MSDGALLAAIKSDVMRHFHLYEENGQTKNEDIYKPHLALLLKHVEGKEAYTDDQGLAGTITRTIVDKHDSLTWARLIQTFYLCYVEFVDFNFVFYPKKGKNIVYNFTLQLHRNAYDNTGVEEKMPSEKINGKVIYHASISKRKQDNSILSTMIKRLFYDLGYFNPVSGEINRTSTYEKLLQEYYETYGDFNKNKKTQRAALQNISNDIAKPRMTWKTCVRALRVAQISAFDIQLNMTRYDGGTYQTEYHVTL